MSLTLHKPKKFHMLFEIDKDGDLFILDGIKYPDFKQADDEAERLIQTGAYKEIYIMAAHTRVSTSGILFETLL